MQTWGRWATGSGLRDWILTVLLGVWFYLLVTPLGTASGIPDMTPFYWYFVAILATDLIIPWNIPKWVMKTVVTVVSLYLLYFYKALPITDWLWLSFLWNDLQDSVPLIMTKHFMELPELTRTLGFFLFLWLAASVYRGALRSRAWQYVLLVVGVIVIAVLDNFFEGVDGHNYITGYFALGLLIVGLANVPVIEKWIRVPMENKGWPVRWAAWAIVVTLLATGTGMAAPKPGPSWPDPVSMFQGKGAGQALGPHKIGYSTDTSVLGGPYEMDDTVAFTVITNDDGYYRGESKEYYTGKGWMSYGDGITVPTSRLPQMTDSTLRDRYGIDQSVKTKEVKQQITIENNTYHVLFSQYQLLGIDSIEQPIQFNPQEMKVLTDLSRGSTYTVRSLVPYYDPDLYKKAPQQSVSSVSNVYTQLPPSVTPKVRDLAEKITTDKQSPFEKAKAIEEYLRTSYTYDPKNVPYPKPDQDFVEQFLFETKRGYCDHFSSSMVVLARSIGLPARWVTGFTAGTPDYNYKGKTEDELKYIVRNQNAHSWAEVYLDGVGWVPFEPTATFSMPVVIQTAAVAPVSTTPEDKQGHNEKADPPSPSISPRYEINWSLLAEIGGLLFAGVAILAIIFRKRLLTVYFLRRSMGSAKGSELVVLGVERLLKIFSRFGWQKEPSATMREFVADINGKVVHGREMAQLTAVFEKVRYGEKETATSDIKEARQLWSRIVRKLGRTKHR